MLKPGKLVFFLIVTVIFAVFACIAFYFIQNSGKKYEVVRLAQSGPSIYKLPHYLADEKAFYNAQQVKIQPVDCKNDAEALSALEGGQADIALVGSASLVFRRAGELKERTNLVVFASLNRIAEYHLTAREDTKLNDIKSLKNKVVIAGQQDSEETIFFENILRDSGLSPYASVTIITNIPEEIRMGALKAGTGHYLLIGNNDLPAALARGFFNVKTFQTDFPSVVCVTTRDYWINRPQAVQGFTNAIYMALIWIKYHTAEETAAACRNTRGIDRVIFNSLVKNCYDSGCFGGSPAIQAKELDTLVRLMDHSREIPMPVNSSEFIDENPVDNSLKLVNYIPEDKREKTWQEKLKFWERQ